MGSTLNISTDDMENNGTEHSWPMMIDGHDDAVKIIYHYHNGHNNWTYHNQFNVMSYKPQVCYNIPRPIVNPRLINQSKTNPINFYPRKTKIFIHPPNQKKINCNIVLCIYPCIGALTFE